MACLVFASCKTKLVFSEFSVRVCTVYICYVLASCDSHMDANLTQLVERLEAVTNRLENVAGPRSASETSSQPEMDSR